MSNPQPQSIHDSVANTSVPKVIGIEGGISQPHTVPSEANPNASDFDLSHFEGQKVTSETTVEYRCTSIVNPNEKIVPIFILKPAHEKYNENFRKILGTKLKNKEQLNPSKNQSEMALKIRDIQLEHGADMFIVGMKNWYDANKKPIPYTPENAHLVWMAQKDHFRDDVIEFCQRMENFSKVPDLLFSDSEEVKNLLKGSSSS